MYRDENVGVARDGSRREWLSTLERYAFPVLGQLPVSAIDAMLVHRVLEPIWSTKPHVGQRLRERIEAVLDYAKAMKLRGGENPALWRGNLQHMLPRANRSSREHHPALSYADHPHGRAAGAAGSPGARA